MGPPPRSLTAEANSCFMVRVPHGSNRIQGCGASIAPECGLPSDQLYRTSNNEGHRVAVTLDTKVLIQGCVKTRVSRECAESFSPFPSFGDGCQSCSSLIQRNREKTSMRESGAGVFTQPGSDSDIATWLPDICCTPKNRHGATVRTSLPRIAHAKRQRRCMWRLRKTCRSLTAAKG